MDNLLTGSFEKRLRNSISFAWKIFMEKTGEGQVSLNKEASMQLHYACILQEVVPLICFREDESAKIELETYVKLPNKPCEIDLVLEGENSRGRHKIAVEMKFFREKAGAKNNFMKGVYVDLSRLEDYCGAGFDEGLALVMTDQETLAHPKKKTGEIFKNFDISHGTKVRDIHLPQTEIGNNICDIRLKKSYEFNWVHKGDFWFMELEGQ